jgi:DNA polymerase IIIc chi subunit
VEVEFHTGLAEPFEHLVRLLRKALRQDSRLCVVSPAVDALSRQLWSFESREFVAHARPGAAAAVWPRSALWLLPSFAHPAPGGTRPPVWVNLGAEAPESLEGCERLIELVAADAEATAAGRQRWKSYLARGHEPVLRFDGANPRP